MLLTTEHGKFLIFQLLPNVFDWYHGVITIVLFAINLQQHRMKDNIQYGGTSCHCFQATNRKPIGCLKFSFFKIRFPQSSPPCLNRVGRLLGPRLARFLQHYNRVLKGGGGQIPFSQRSLLRNPIPINKIS